MIIENEAAIQYFDQEAEKLIGLWTEFRETGGIKPTLKSIAEEEALSIDESKIKPLYKMHVDQEGNEMARYFYVEPGKWVGLDKIGYLQFKKLLDSIYKKREINTLITEESLTNIIFEWIKSKYLGAESEPLRFINYLNGSIEEKIKNYRISIPISYMAINGEFEIGKVKFEFLRKNLFDEFENELKKKVESKEITNNEAANIIHKLRKDYQGKVVGTVNVKAEMEKAKEIAEREVDKAIMALKLFSVFAFAPKNTAFFGRKGIAWIPSRYSFIFSNGLPEMHEGVSKSVNIIYKIDETLLDFNKKAGLDKLSKLFLRVELNEFEELLLTAIYTFTKAISQINYHEKIVFILSALEIIFLKDSSEPIQVSCGQRLGFFIENEADRRREVVQLINGAYKIRSNFLHHGEEKEDYEILLRLQIVCWKALCLMIKHHDEFKNKPDFISFIERLIYS